jgi:capsid portal protein
LAFAFRRTVSGCAPSIPPQLMEIVPSNTGGFGAADKAAEVFGVNEITPLQRRFEQINEWVGEQVVRFGPYAEGGSSGA